jgi:hypothetical protein
MGTRSVSVATLHVAGIRPSNPEMGVFHPLNLRFHSAREAAMAAGAEGSSQAMEPPPGFPLVQCTRGCHGANRVWGSQCRAVGCAALRPTPRTPATLRSISASSFDRCSGAAAAFSGIWVGKWWSTYWRRCAASSFDGPASAPSRCKYSIPPKSICGSD